MTELFKEAIIEARKLKEVAELDARNKVIEAVTPIIKRMIAKESSTQKFLFGEDDLPMEDPMMSAEPPMEVPDMAPPTDAGLPPAGGDISNAAPISPSGDLVGMPMPDDEGKITVDFSQLFSMGSGSQGVEDAASQEVVPPPGDLAGGLPPMPTEVPPVAPIGGAEVPPAGVAGVGPEAGAAQALDPASAALPAAPGAIDGQAPVGQALTPEENPEPIVAGESKIYNFQNEVRVVAERIDLLYFRGSAPSLVKESVKSRLFTLCEQLDDLMSEGVISPKKARIAENKLEFLFMKLNEAEERNTYKTDKGAHMTSLKEFAAKLFEEDALGPATADKATAHAEKVSGVAPGVDLFKEGEEPVDDTATMAEALLGEDAPASSAFGDGKLEGDAENKNPQVHDADALVKEPGAGIVESAPASTAFGDGTEMPGAENTNPQLHQSGNLADESGSNSILEFDEKELREAVVKLRKENLARKLKAVKESAAAGLKGSVSDKEGLTVPKVKVGDQGSAKPVGGKEPAQENLAECGMTEETPMGDSGGLPGMPGAGGGEEVELTFSIDVDDLEALLNGAADQFVAEPEGDVGGDDAGGFPGSDSMGGDDDSIEVVGDDSPEGLLVDEPAEEPTTDEAAGASAPGKLSVKENKSRQVSGKTAIASLVKQLNEQKLLTAKALYVSKFTVREDLSSKQKQKIVGYFDKASTLAEAKETYAKIKKILSENASTPSTKLSGSGSKPTTAGSAKLNESVSGNTGDQIESARWMLLAGIPSKK